MEKFLGGRIENLILVNNKKKCDEGFVELILRIHSPIYTLYALLIKISV